jgi:lipid-A-disaccharide synthase
LQLHFFGANKGNQPFGDGSPVDIPSVFRRKQTFFRWPIHRNGNGNVLTPFMLAGSGYSAAMVTAHPLRLLLSAAEPSGDRLAAELLHALKGLREVEVRAVAGPALRAEGVAEVAAVEDLSVNGLQEVLARWPSLRRTRARIHAALDDAPDLLVTVDAPDLHLPLARAARARGIRTVGYVSPQVWAWRPGRARTIARDLDRLLCLFPFEPALYTPHGLDARFVGHPVVDRLAGAQRAPRPGCFALLPGSRPEELRRLLPVFLKTARAVRRARPEVTFRLGLVERADPAQVPPEEGVKVVEGLAAAAAEAEAALVASGTATLELAVLGVPMVVAYQVHPTTYALGRLLVRGVRHIALPNILAGKGIVPEHLQRLDPQILANDLLRVAGDATLPERLAEVRDTLGPPGAAKRAAKALLEPFPG